MAKKQSSEAQAGAIQPPVEAVKATAPVAPPQVGDRVIVLAPEGVPGLNHLAAYAAEVTSIHPDAPTTVSVRVLDGGHELNGVPYLPKVEALAKRRGNTWWR